MWIALVPIVLMGAGFAAWMFFFKDGVIARAHANWAKAQAEFDANEAAILGKYWNDENRFKPLQSAIGAETIVGATNGYIPKKLGEKVMTGLKEAVTNTITFDMGASFILLTDRNLHFVKFDGSSVIDHQVFSLAAMQSTALVLEDGGQVQKLTFTANGQPQIFHVSGTLSGYPRFEVDESMLKTVMAHDGDRSNPFYRKYAADNAELGEMGDTIDMIVRRKYSKGFIDRMQQKFGLRWPDAFQI